MAQTDNLKMINTGEVFRHLGTMDPQEFVQNFGNQFTPKTLQNLLAYQLSNPTALNPKNYDRFRAQRAMEMARRLQEQGPVTPEEYNAMSPGSNAMNY